MIERLVLRNWKSHHRTEVTFEPGTNVIIGINGAGKSSVLEAIYFSLFGPPERGYYERVIRSGEKEASVELTFTHNGKQYTVRRTFTAKGITEAILRGEGEAVITNRVSDVDKKISEILGMSGDAFRQAVYARQNEMAEILQNKSKRKELMDEMLEMAELSNVRDVVVALRNRIKDWLRGLSAANIEEEMASIETEIKRARERLESAKKELMEREEALRNVVKQITTLEEDVRHLEQDVKRKRDAEARLRQTEGEKRGIESRIREIEEKYGTENATKDDLNVKKKELEELTKIEKLVAELRARMVSKEKELERIKDSIENTQDVKSAEMQADLAKQELTKLMEKRDQLLKKKAELEERVKNNKRLLEMLKKDLKEAERFQKELESIEKRFGDVRTRLNDAKKRLETLKDTLAKILAKREQETAFVSALEGAKACPVCGSPLSEEKRQELIHAHKKDAESAEQQIEKLRDEIKRVEAEITELESASERLSAISEKLAGIEEKEAEVRKMEREIKEIEHTLNTVKRDIVDLDEKIQQVRKKYDEAMMALERAKRAETERKYAEKLSSEIEQIKRTVSEYEGILNTKDRKKLEAEIERLSKLVERVELLKQLEELKKAEAEYAKTVDALANVEEKYMRTKERLAELKEKKRATEDVIERLRWEIRDVEERIHRQENRLKQLRETKERMEKRQKLLTTLERMINALEETQRIVRDARIRAINHVLNVVWRGLYPRKDITEIRLRPEKNDYTLEVKRAGKWVAVDTLSGGEFYDAALALRIAISALKARNVGWLLLDEPTHNLDREATEALAKMLNELPAKGLFKQIIVITHDETLQHAATGTVYVFERDKDHNKPTQVRKLAVTG